MALLKLTSFASALQRTTALSARHGRRALPVPPCVTVSASSSDRQPRSRPASTRRGDSMVRRAQKADTALTTLLDPMDFGFHSPMFELTNRLMEEMMSPALSRVGGATAPSTVLLDLVQKENEYVATAELPGFGEEDVSITVDGRMLTIKAGHVEKEEKSDEETGRVVHSERRARQFVRTFRLPKDVDDENIAASMDKGILYLHLPRAVAELPTAREIPVLKGEAAKESLPENKEE